MRRKTFVAAAGREDGTRSIRKAVSVLRALAGARTGARISEVVEKCALPRPTVYRILGGLVEEQLVVKIPGSERYALGPLVHELGLAAAPPVGLREICAPFVEHIAEATGDTASLTLRSGLDGVCADRQCGSFPIKALPVEIGARRPLGFGLGSVVILASLPLEEREAVMRANAARYRALGTFTVDRIRRLVRHVEQKGFAFTASDFIDGVGGFATVLRHSMTGAPLAALSVASVVSRMPASRGKEIVPLLRRATIKINKALSDLADLPN